MQKSSPSKIMRSTTQRNLPAEHEVDREKLNKGGRHLGNPKKHDGQTDDRSKSQRGNSHPDHQDRSNDNYN